MTILAPSPLAIHGGNKAVKKSNTDLFHWPIVTKEDEDAVLEVMRKGIFSRTEITAAFENEMAQWHQRKYAMAYCNGTASLLGAMFGCGISAGDEVIVPAFTYWATFMPLLNLGATPVFADIDANTLCINPLDIIRKISPRTKAIIVLHAFGHPCQMDEIMAIANKHNLKVIEDVSHAQGGLYQGKLLGSIGHVGCMSLMGGKSFAVGEGGMLLTDDNEIMQRAAAFGFYERTTATNWSDNQDLITIKELQPWKGMPAGGFKHRMNQTCSAMGRVQLKYYPERIAEIQKAMNFFWDLLEGVPGIKAHRIQYPHTMGGWYHPVAIYQAHEVEGLSSEQATKAIREEGASTAVCAKDYSVNHLHPLLQTADIYGHGKPTVIAHSQRDTRLKKGDLPVTESMVGKVITIPWFKKFQPDSIEQHANAFKKVLKNYKELL